MDTTVVHVEPDTNVVRVELMEVMEEHSYGEMIQVPDDVITVQVPSETYVMENNTGEELETVEVPAETYVMGQETGGYEQGTGEYEQGTGEYVQGTGEYVQGTGGDEQGTGGYEQGTVEYEQGTGEYVQGTGGDEQGTGGYEQGTVQYEQGTGEYVQGTGGDEQGTGEYEQGTGEYEQEADEEQQGTGEEHQGTGEGINQVPSSSVLIDGGVGDVLQTSHLHDGSLLLHQLADNALASRIQMTADGIFINQVTDNTVETYEVPSDTHILRQVRSDAIQTIQMPSDAIEADYIPANTLLTLRIPQNVLFTNQNRSESLAQGPNQDHTEILEDTVDISQNNRLIINPLTGELEEAITDDSESLEDTMDVSQNRRMILNPLTGELEVAVTDESSDEEIVNTNDMDVESSGGDGFENKKVNDNIGDVNDNEEESCNDLEAKVVKVDAEADQNNTPFMCGICLERFDKLSVFYAHFQTHDNSERYLHSCERNKLLEALNVTENVDNNLYKCSICQMAFPSMCLLHEHMVKDEKVSDYKYSHEIQAIMADEEGPADEKKKGKMKQQDKQASQKSGNKKNNIKIIGKSANTKGAIKNETKTNAENKKVIEDKALTSKKNAAKLTTKTTGTRAATRALTLKVEKEKEINTAKKTPGKKIEEKVVSIVTPGKRIGQKMIGKETPGKKSDGTVVSKETPGKKSDGTVVNKETPGKKSDRTVVSKETPGKRTAKMIGKEAPGKKIDENMVGIKQEPVEIPIIQHSYGTRHSAKKLAASKTRGGLRAFTESTEKKYKKLASNANLTKVKEEIKVQLISKFAKGDRNEENKMSTRGKREEPKEEPKVESKVESKAEDIEAVDIKPETEAVVEMESDEEKEEEILQQNVDMEHEEVEEKEETAEEISGEKYKMEHGEEITTFTPILNKPGQLMSCDTCGKIITSRASMRKHRVVHMTTRNFHCDKCGKSYKSRGHLVDHLRRIDHGSLKCSLCDVYFKNEQSRKRHVRKFHKKENNLDNEESSVLEKRIETMRKNTENIEEEMTTENVNTEEIETNVKADSAGDVEMENVVKAEVVKTEDGSENKKDISENTEVKTKKGKAPRDFWKRKRAKRNPFTHKMGPMEACPVCGKVMTKKAIRKHQVVHVKTRDFECEVCGKSYKSKGHLEDHIRRIEHKAEIECSICEKRVKNIKRHMLSQHNISDDAEQYQDSEDKSETEEQDVSYIACTECGKVFTPKMLKKHMICHIKTRDFACNMCGKTFKSSGHVKEHIRIVHAKPIMPCDICKKKFKTMTQLQHHKAVHIRRNETAEMFPDGPLKGGSGDEETMMDGTTVKVEDMFQAMYNDDADSETEKDMDMEGAEKDSQGISDEDLSMECETVKVEVSEGIDPEAGASADTKQVLFPCEACGKVCRNLAILTRHMLVHKVTREHLCIHCGSGFKSRDHLKDHVDHVHVAERKHVCNICGIAFKTNKSLWHHKNTHLNPSNKFYSDDVVEQLQNDQIERIQMRAAKYRRESLSTRVCDVCGLTVLSKRMSRHRSTHRKTKDFECEICHKSYIAQRYVNDHKKKVHTEERIICDICGQFFKGKASLKIHRQIHGPRDKQCPKCDKKFTTDFYLRVHLNTHEVKKRFKCTECDAAFSHKPRLDIHLVEKHSLGQRRPCKYCGLTFPSRQKARIHERKAHEGYRENINRRRARSRAAKREKQMMMKYQIVENTVEEVEEYEEVKNAVEHVMFTKNEDGGTIEHILEIPENTEQCQILLFPNGTFKVLNASEGQAVELVTGEISS